MSMVGVKSSNKLSCCHHCYVICSDHEKCDSPAKVGIAINPLYLVGE